MTNSPQKTRSLLRFFRHFIMVLGLTLLVPNDITATDTMQPIARAAQSDSVGFEAAWLAILETSGIQYELVIVPHGRKRRMFIDGAIQLDCCSTPEWRATEEELNIQLFSDSFYETTERYVFPKGKVQSLDNPEALRALRVAVVRDFNYPFESFFGYRVVGRYMNDVLHLVEQGRANVGIISNIDFARLTATRPRRLELGGINYRASLRIRIRTDRPDLLAPINTAIEQLKSSNCLTILIEQQSDNCLDELEPKPER